MPRLRNELTGAVMIVEESTAALLGSEWKPEAVKTVAEDKPAPRRAQSSK
jgi:hypothetical protein